jgi:T5orf172 domain
MERPVYMKDFTEKPVVRKQRRKTPQQKGLELCGSYVMFAESDPGFCKIGAASNLKTRLKDGRTWHRSNLIVFAFLRADDVTVAELGKVKASQKAEDILQCHFDKHWCDGEWYERTREDIITYFCNGKYKLTLMSEHEKYQPLIDQMLKEKKLIDAIAAIKL